MWPESWRESEVEGDQGSSDTQESEREKKEWTSPCDIWHQPFIHYDFSVRRIVKFTISVSR